MISSSLAGRSGFRRTGATGLLCKIESNRFAVVSPRNGCLQVAISYKTAPKENKSVRASSSFPKSGLRGVARRYRNSPSGDLGQSKVEDLGMATFGHEDVRWFDVAMDN